MTNKEKALAYIKQMRLIDMDSQEFTNDMVWMSVQDNDQARSGAMFRLDDDVRRKINELEQTGSIVWHIIQGTYRFWNEPEIGTEINKPVSVYVPHRHPDGAATLGALRPVLFFFDPVWLKQRQRPA